MPLTYLINRMQAAILLRNIVRKKRPNREHSTAILVQWCRKLPSLFTWASGSSLKPSAKIIYDINEFEQEIYDLTSVTKKFATITCLSLGEWLTAEAVVNFQMISKSLNWIQGLYGPVGNEKTGLWSEMLCLCFLGVNQIVRLHITHNFHGIVRNK